MKKDIMRYIGIILVLLFIIGCGSTQMTVDPAKEQELKDMIMNKEFKLLMNTASPLNTLDISQLSFMLPNGSTPSRIFLNGGEDYFKMSGDTISADMAYFGTQQLGGEYNSNKAGIIFNGAYNEYHMKYDEEKKIYTLSYKINNKRESFNINVKIWLNWKCEVYINTSHRSAINYNGFVSKYIKKTNTTNK